MKKFYKSFWLFLLFLLLPLYSHQEEDPPKQIRTPSGIEMIIIPGGWFMMGNEKGEIDEKPVHKIYISSFYMDKYPVTQEDFEKLMGENPSKWRGGKNPVEQLTWAAAVKYCNVRSRLEGLKSCYDTEIWECNFEANGYRLPAEAEWEYACRAGTNTSYSFGDDERKLKHFAWLKENSGGRPRPVGQKLPNPWRLYDMHGNVGEWCNDFYKVDYYQESPDKDPRGPRTGQDRVVRGGSWNSKHGECRSCYRYKEGPGYADVCIAGYDVYGFRCVRNF